MYFRHASISSTGMSVNLQPKKSQSSNFATMSTTLITGCPSCTAQESAVRWHELAGKVEFRFAFNRGQEVKQPWCSHPAFASGPFRLVFRQRKVRPWACGYYSRVCVLLYYTRAVLAMDSCACPLPMCSCAMVPAAHLSSSSQFQDADISGPSMLHGPNQYT